MWLGLLLSQSEPQAFDHGYGGEIIKDQTISTENLPPKYRRAPTKKVEREMGEGSAKDLFSKKGLFAKNQRHI